MESRRRRSTLNRKTCGELYSRFANAIKENKEELVPVHASEGRYVLRVIEAAKISAKGGRTVTF